MLSNGADVDVKNFMGDTALHTGEIKLKSKYENCILIIFIASFGGKYHTVAILLSNKAQINLKNNDGNTALHYGILNSNYYKRDYRNYNTVLFHFVQKLVIMVKKTLLKFCYYKVLRSILQIIIIKQLLTLVNKN